MARFNASATWTRLSFTIQRRMDLYEDLAAFEGSGRPPFQALTKMRQVARPRRTMQWLVKLLNPVLRSMEEGQGVAASLRPWIPAEEAAMLSAGESGGQLREAMIEAASLLKARLEIKASLKRNLIPSLIMMVAVTGVMVFVMKTVLPQGRGMVAPEIFDALSFAPYYFGFGEWLIDWIGPLSVFSVLASIVIGRSLPLWRPDSARMWLDRATPPWTLFARVQSSFFLITAASMMRAGRPFKTAVEDIHRHAQPWLKAHTRRMLSRLAAGQDEIKSMQVGMLPWDTEDRLAVYADLPDFMVVMDSTARDSVRILLRRVDLIGNMIKSIVMVCLGLFVVSTMLAMGEVSMAIQASLNQGQY